MGKREEFEVAFADQDLTRDHKGEYINVNASNWWEVWKKAAETEKEKSAMICENATHKYLNGAYYARLIRNHKD